MSSRSVWAVIATGLSIPVVLIGTPVVTIVVVVVLLHFEQPADLSRQYEVVMLDDARCLVRVNASGGYELGPDPPPTKPVRLQGKRMRANDLVGACAFASGVSGKITEVFTTPAGPDNHVRIQLPGESVTHDLPLTCLCASSPPELVATSGSHNPSVAVGAGRVWWRAETSLRSRDKTLGAKENSVPGTEDNMPEAMLVGPKHLYTFGIEVTRIAHSGGTAQELWSDGRILASTSRARFVGTNLVFLHGKDLFRLPAVGGTTEKVVGDVAGFDAQGEEVVYNRGGKLTRIGKSGQAEAIASATPHPNSPVAMLKGVVFYIDPELNLRSLGSKGESKTYRKTRLVPKQLWAVPGHVYWLLEEGALSSGTLKRYDLDADRSVNVIPGDQIIGAVTTDDRHVYWMSDARVARQTHDALHDGG